MKTSLLGRFSGTTLNAAAFWPAPEAHDQFLPDDRTNRKNFILLIQLRWIAVVGQIATIMFVWLALGIGLPVIQMIYVAAGLAVLNLFDLAWLHHRTKDVSNPILMLMLMLDVAALTAQFYLSGGATNPFISLYILQVVLGAVLLDAWSAWVVVAFTCISFCGMTVFYRPLTLPDDQFTDMFTLHIVGMAVCFALDAILLVVFMTRIARNLRDRDARVAALKQSAAEEDLLVRMGLLASGAAHELGTPLASLSVILNDWRRMPELTADKDRLEEIEDMQAEVQRCKSIVTGVLRAAGEARGEAPRITSVDAFLDELVDEWRNSRSAATLSFTNSFGADVPIISDSALKQVIFNVLDNANEVSPHQVNLAAGRESDNLVLCITDAGPGFSPAMLTNFGKPYHSTKGDKSRGIGLFLLVNVARKLGGRASAANNPDGGAAVTLSLPLEALATGKQT